jgi:hypothetical protein
MDHDRPCGCLLYTVFRPPNRQPFKLQRPADGVEPIPVEGFDDFKMIAMLLELFLSLPHFHVQIRQLNQASHHDWTFRRQRCFKHFAAALVERLCLYKLTHVNI